MHMVAYMEYDTKDAENSLKLALDLFAFKIYESMRKTMRMDGPFFKLNSSTYENTALVFSKFSRSVCLIAVFAVLCR